MYSCIQPFQLEDADNLVIHLYNNDSHYRVPIEEFKRSKRESLRAEGSELDLSIEYMLRLADVPEQYSK
ncbi:hypothetical protein D3C76_1646520 [compost metagenome]